MYLAMGQLSNSPTTSSCMQYNIVQHIDQSFWKHFLYAFKLSRYCSLAFTSLSLSFLSCPSKHKSSQVFQPFTVAQKKLNLLTLDFIVSIIQLFIGEQITNHIFSCHILKCILKIGLYAYFSIIKLSKLHHPGHMIENLTKLIIIMCKNELEIFII